MIRRKIILFFFLAGSLAFHPVTTRAESASIALPSAETNASADPQRLERLRRGEILTDGGYLSKGVWGLMQGVIHAPPKVVWRLFLQTNEWNKYHLPELSDCRAVSQEVADGARSFKKVEEFYALLGGRVFDPTQDQRTGTVWRNNTFQYYDLPWPVSNKWMILKNTHDETRGASGFYSTMWEKGGGNVRTISGEIRIEPFEGNLSKTLLTYRVETDPGSAVPKFLMKWGVKRSMPAAIRIIRRESARLMAQPPPLLKTQ